MKIFKMTLTILALSASLTATVAMAAQNDQREPTSNQFSCEMNTGYGRVLGRGASAREALKQAAYQCGMQLMDRTRGDISEDTMADIIDGCNAKSCE